MHTAANVTAFRDFHINENWVWNFLSAGKISIAVARAEFQKVTRHLSTNLDQLAAVERAQREDTIRRAIAETAALLEPSFAQFKVLPAVEAWERECEDVVPRRRFLVLCGGSGLGKTEYARSRAKEHHVGLHEVDCAGSQYLDLRAFNWCLHKYLLLDEASVDMVMRNRKVLQGPNCLCSLGDSSTGMYSYKVYTYGVRIIICSNTWVEEVAELSLANQQWLQRNSVVINVTDRLWEWYL